MIAAPDLSAIQLHVPLPVMHRARQTFEGPVLEDVEGETSRQVGVVDACGMPVYVAETALEADGVIVVNRVKPHTDFNGPIESGLAKICTIGIGKQKGAQSVHSYGVPGLAQWMPLAAKVVVKHANVLFGVAIVENAY